MSNLFSYFQRIDQKKMSATTTDNSSVRQAASTTPKSDTKSIKSTTQTPKEPARSSRNKVDMTDVYSSDISKSEKRKKCEDHGTTDHEESLQQPKSSIRNC